MRMRPMASLVAALAALGLMLPAGAADFSPSTRFTVRPGKVRQVAAVTVAVAQDAGEEELASVRLVIPAGFRLPGDAAIDDGEQIGEGEIEIAAGPGCAGGVGTAPVTVPVEIVERDRTAEERSAGVRGVWVVDLQPVTTIDLLLRGSQKRGWRLDGQIPQNSATCPPFSFTATLAARSADRRTPIFRNPAKAGRYTFAAIYRSVDGSTARTSQKVRITK